MINDTFIANDRFSGGNVGESSPLSFALKAQGDYVDLDASSPRLWKTSPVSSPPPGTSDTYQPMSPNSRTEAIERGRKEMMEMIKDLPESFYELSLRDLVDQNYSQISPHPLADREFQETDDDNKVPLMANSRKEKKTKKTMTKNRSFDNGGYLLKTSVFPCSFSLRRNKKKNLKKNLFSTGPNPAAVATKSSEKDSWRTKSSEESESSVGLSCSNSGSSSESTSRSSSSGSRQGQSSRFIPGCCSFRKN